MKQDETPKTIAPTDENKDTLEARFFDAAERLLPQLTDEEWELLLERLHEERRRRRPFQFNRRIGYLG